MQGASAWAPVSPAWAEMPTWEGGSRLLYLRRHSLWCASPHLYELKSERLLKFAPGVPCLYLPVPICFVIPWVWIVQYSLSLMGTGATPMPVWAAGPTPYDSLSCFFPTLSSFLTPMYPSVLCRRLNAAPLQLFRVLVLYISPLCPTNSSKFHLLNLLCLLNSGWTLRSAWVTPSSATV